MGSLVYLEVDRMDWQEVTRVHSNPLKSLDEDDGDRDGEGNGDGDGEDIVSLFIQ